MSNANFSLKSNEGQSIEALERRYLSLFDQLLTAAPFSLDRAAKQALLAQTLECLDYLHRQKCSAYANIQSLMGSLSNLNSIDDRFLAVRLFKLQELASIGENEVFKVLNSSGTSGQSPARILLDRATSARQSKTLVNILQVVLGKQRLPMLIIDSEAVARGRHGFSARTAGIQGLSFFGRKHVYALHDDMTPNWEAIEAFFDSYGEQPVLLFGFTFMIWQYLIRAAKEAGKQFQAREAIIIHSGGWKKLESEKVDNKAFKQACSDIIEGSRVHNFYGMAEQVGSIFIECSEGHLHAPNMADIIVRDPYSLSVVDHKERGLLQVQSSLPTSYPGHSLLTEDMERILGEDDCACGWKGKYFEVLGRLPKAEVRGCSDTHE